MRLTGLDLTCVRGGREVFAGIGFSVAAGAALAVTGHNGAGKSSLLRIVAGLLAPESGRVLLEGAASPDSGSPANVPEATHYLGHRDAIKASLTVMENLAFWRDMLAGGSGRTDEAGRTNLTAEGTAEGSVQQGFADRTVSSANALATVGLDHVATLPAAFLSAGQRRRLSLARLAAVRRPVWLLDEPGAALDADGHALLAALMRGHLADGGVILAATHAPLGVDAAELRIGGAA